MEAARGPYKWSGESVSVLLPITDCIVFGSQESRSNALPVGSLGPVKPEVGRVFVLSNQMIFPLFGCSKRL